MKIISYTALLYNKYYLGYALRSVEPYVDEMWVLYAAGGGSHGSRTLVPCPDTREELYSIARAVAGDKLRWIDGDWRQENEQRGAIHQYAPDADVILVVDADELWPPHYADSARLMWETGHAEARFYRLPMVHFWRSFYRAVLHDPAYPQRIIYPRIENGTETYRGYTIVDNSFYNQRLLSIAHMGYAIPTELVRWKWLIHGHKNELRKDIDWFRDRWDCNAQVDCHPVGSEWWNPEQVNPWDYLPTFMKAHPFAELELIP